MSDKDYWQKQESEALFPDVLWSKPETRRGAGKLLIIGGQAQEFADVAAAYAAAEKAGAGTIRVLMPSSTEKLTKHLPNIEYAPSNPSGSFSRQALATFLEASTWAEQVLLAGDLGKNSETTTILDGYLLKCPTPVTLASGVFESIALPIPQLLNRPAILALTQSQVQKLGTALGLQTPITSTMSHRDFAQILHNLTLEKRAALVCELDEKIWVADKGRVCSCSHTKNVLAAAATAAVWAMQQPTKRYEALVTSMLD